MIDTLRIFEELKDEIAPSAAKKIAETIGRVFTELRDTVIKEEFAELRKIIAELAQAQKRTEQRIEELAEAQKRSEGRLDRLEKVVEELAQAQKRTEQRIEELAEAQKRSEGRLDRLEKVVEELAQAQKRTEERLEELAQAQKRTEERVEELAQAQKRTEERVEELAQAQKRTEQELRALIGEHKKTREQLGGLTHTVGYVLEDRAYKGLPALLARDFNLEITEPIKRDYIEISPGVYEEINIIGRARRDGKSFVIIGECKTQLKKADIDAFLKRVRRLEKAFSEERILIAVTYQASPPVRAYASEKGVKLYFSYEMPL